MADIGSPRYGGSQRFFVALRKQELDDEQAAEGICNIPAVVGFIRWEVLLKGTLEGEWQAHKCLWPEIKASPKDVIGVDVPHMRVSQVYVHPACGRQGIGAQLMAFALKEADELNLPVYVEATPDGHKLYASKGFESKKELSWDLSIMEWMASPTCID